MSQLSFRQVLIRLAAPRLKALGYEYDNPIRDRNIDYRFSKLLGENIRVQITFQRHQRNEIPYGYGFTVNLDRYKTASPAQQPHDNYEGGFHARLPHLIVSAFGLRIYPRQDYWWEAETADELQNTLADAVEKLEKYGIPALEHRQFRYISVGVGVKAWNIFQDILNKVVLAELSALGYEPQNDPVQYWTHARGNPHRNFTRALGDGLYAIIGFHPLARLNRDGDDEPARLMGKPEFHHFGILIARNRSTDPNAEIPISDPGCFRGWLGPQALTRSDLSAIIFEGALWEYIEAPGALYEYDAAMGTPIWKYPDNVRESLTTQLKNGVDKIKRDCVPWLQGLP